MSAPRTIASALACLCFLGSACTATRSSAASDDGAPPSTIGLGFEFEAEPGIVRAVADVRAVEPESIDSVVMVGDSITVASTPALEQRFEQLGFDSVLIEAETSKRMTLTDRGNSSGQAIVTYLAGTDEDGDHSNELWVVALGTNDINQYSSGEEIQAEVDALAAAVPHDAALIWVDTFAESELEGAARINHAITRLVSARGNAVVAPWSLFATEAISSDGLHPTPEGREVFAGIVAGTVASFVGA